MISRSLLRRGVALVGPHRRLFAAVLAAQGASALSMGVVDPLMLKLVIDSLGRGDVPAFAWAVGLSVAVATGFRLLDYGASLWSQRLTNGVTEQLVGDAFGAFCATPPAALERQDDGYYVSRVFDEPERVAAITGLLSALVQGVLLAAGALAVCVWLAWEVTPVLALAVPVLVAVSVRYGKRIAEATVRGQEQEARLRGDLGRSVGAHRTVWLFGLGAPVRAVTEATLGRLLETRYRLARHVGALGLLSGLFLSYAEIGVIAGAGALVLTGAMTVGGLFAFSSGFWRVVNASRSLIDLLPQAATLDGMLERVDAFGQGREPAAPEPTAGAAGALIDASDLAFGYEAPLFDGVSFRLGRDERVLVTGENGAGKSTLGHLLAGTLAPQHGAVRRSGRVSAALLPFGFVPGTGLDTLDYDRRTPAERARIARLAARFGLAGKLARDPETLSQGEQRKLQVLTALAKPADVYVFDEPLSNVDVASRTAVMDTILEETRGAGLVVIMHGDERFVPRFGRVECLSGGRLTAQPPPPLPGVASLSAAAL